MESLKPPSTLTSIGIIARFELVRLFQTTRGLLSIAAFAIVWYFIFKELIYRAAQWVSVPGFRESMSDMFGQIGLANLLQWPVAEFVMFWLFALLLFPILTVMITADQTSSDRSRGTLRFLTLRATRDSIFFGRFLGQLIIQCLLIGGLLLATFAMAMWNNSDNFSFALTSAIIMGTNLLIVVLPFTAMMAFFSASVRSSRLAVIVAIICWGFSLGLINYLAMKIPPFGVLINILPGTQLPDLIQANDWATLKHAWLPLLQTLGFLLLGRTIVQRSSL